MSLAETAERFGIGNPSEEIIETHSSGVSWGAVVAGAFVTAALSLIMLSLGAGLGLSSLSFWGNAGPSASQVGAAAILWLVFNEIVSSAMGGYLAGRLRTKWRRIHNDEVYFRDTAHGLLAWSVAVVISVSFMAAAATSMAGSPVAGSVSKSYFVDLLFRTDQPAAKLAESAVRDEAGRIITYGLKRGDISPADETYLGQLVALQTGLNQKAAQQRVSTVVLQARNDFDAGRKASAHLLLWIFVALLAGAFSASLAATLGGRQRDDVRTI
jgi:hypothetical protein